MIHLQDIRKYFGRAPNHVKALDGITLTVRRGEALAVTGASGSGKSTLLDIIGTLSRLTSGTYFLDRRDIGGVNEKTVAGLRNRSFGFIFQNFHLMKKRTVFENVALPLEYAASPLPGHRERVLSAIETVGLDHRVNTPVNRLSGGEQQRVAIARAIVMDPEIILADEPTGNLDSHTGSRILRILTGLWKRGKTVILVTHNENQAALFPRKITLRDGKILEDMRPTGELRAS